MLDIQQFGLGFGSAVIVILFILMVVGILELRKYVKKLLIDIEVIQDNINGINDSLNGRMDEIDNKIDTNYDDLYKNIREEDNIVRAYIDKRFDKELKKN
jgi:hypothetical protein